MADRRIGVRACAIGAAVLGAAGLAVWSFGGAKFLDGAGSVSNGANADSDPTALPADEAQSRAAAKRPILDVAQRELLWLIEHQGNVLGDSGFKAISAALKKADGQALARLLAADFRAEAPGPDSELVRETSFVKAVRRRDEGHPLETLNREQFVARLLELRALFQAEPKVKVSLKGLAPVSRDRVDGQWAGSALLRMWGEAAPGEPGEVIVNLSYVVGHPENEIAPAETAEGAARPLAREGWWHAATITQSLATHATRFLMRDVTKDRGAATNGLWDNWVADAEGLPTAPASGGAFLSDYNRDGYVDMLITDINGTWLYQGLPEGKFKDATEPMGLAKYNGREWNKFRREIAIFIDVDGDGWEDLLLGGIMLRNDQGREFVEAGARTNLKVPTAMIGGIVGDYDRDGRLDLYLVQAGRGKADSWLDGRSGNPEPNMLWRNTGNWTFENVTKKSGAGGDFRSTFSSVFIDANNDNWPDLYVINEFGDGVLLVNNQDGTFHERQFSDRPVDYGTMGLTAGDINNDGHVDIYVANMYSKAGNRVFGNLLDGSYEQPIMERLRSLTVGSQLYLNRGDNRFEGVGRQWQVHDVGWAYGPALVDFDNDGWLDLYATCGFISRDRDKPDG